MGFQVPETGFEQANPYKSFQPRETDAVSVLEQVGAGFQLDNMATNVIQDTFSEENNVGGPRIDPEVTGYDYKKDLRPGEELVPEFQLSTSPSDTARIRKQLDREAEVARQMGEGPLPAIVATLPAVMLDLDMLLPYGALMKAGKLTSRLVRGAAAGAGSNAMAEAVLHQTQMRRSVDESAAAILFGAVLGSGIGAAFGRSERALLDQAASDLVDISRGLDAEGGVAPAFAQSVGAAGARMTPEETLPTEGFGGGKLGRATAAIPGVRSPAVELSFSPLANSRDTILRLVDTGLSTRGMELGRAPVEDVWTSIKSYDRMTTEANHNLDVLVKQHRQATDTPMSRSLFLEQVGRAAARGDTDVDPFVTQAAQYLRKNIIDPLTKRAQALGLLPEDLDVRTAPSYFTRVYDHRKIKARYPEFKTIVQRWLRMQEKDLGAKGTDMLNDPEIEDLADVIGAKILGHSSERVPFIKVPAARGPLKERTFNIPDEMIEPFLVRNAADVMERFIRTMSADIEMTRAFGRPDPNDQVASEIMREARQAAGDKKLTEKQREALINRGKREAEVASALIDRIRGVDATPLDSGWTPLIRTGQVFRTGNLITKLGLVTFSAFPDVHMLITRNGMSRVMGGLFTETASGFKNFKAAKEDLQLFGGALDMARARTVQSIYDTGTGYARNSKFERGIDATGRVFMTAVGQNPWNVFWKTMSSLMASTRILKSAETLAKGGTLSPRDRRLLAQNRISEEMAVRIAGERKNWQKGLGGVLTTGGLENWSDKEAARAFGLAISREADGTVITPTPGDSPLWTSTELGKTVFQFKRFGMSAHHRILIANLQNPDTQALQGVSTAVALGYLSTLMRDLVNDGEPRERTAAEWAADSVDRSGVLSLLIEGDSMLGKSTGWSVNRAITGQDPTRYQSRGVAGQFLGPTVGLFEDLSGAVRRNLDGEGTQADLRAIRRLMPGQNAPVLSYLFDEWEKALAREFNIPERASRKGSGASGPSLPLE